MALYLWLKNWLAREEGQDLIEYALLVGLIVIIVIAAIRVAGTSVSTIFQTISDELSGI
jgi:pilus assembly protein Flp/PilA